MSEYRVGFAPDAVERIAEIRAWWIANRHGNPRLFDSELWAVRRRVVAAPRAGERYAHPRVPGVRRVLMPRSRYHVYYVVDDAELGAKVDALAGEIASGAKGSNAAVKKLLLTSLDNTIEAQMELESQFIAANADGADGREGIDAFLNKRAPEFA